MTQFLITGERRTEHLHFTMSIELLMKIRETTTAHEVASYIRRALITQMNHCPMLNEARRGNKCSLIIRVTPKVAKQLFDRAANEMMSNSVFIESCCWAFIEHQSQTPDSSP